MYPAHPPVPPYPQDNIQRSWSDEHIPVNNRSEDPIAPAPRSSSFSASRASLPQWNHHPPPPVPPLPPALQPGFHSPPLVHANLDLTFTEPHCRPPPPQPWPAVSSNGRSSSHSFTLPIPRPASEYFPSWHSVDQRNYPAHSSSFGPPPVVPPRPMTTYIPEPLNLGDRRPSSYALAQDFRTSDYSAPLPAVPPRPTTAHDEASFQRSPMTRSQVPLSSSPPPIPPKTLTSPVLLPSREHIPSPSGPDNTVSPSSDGHHIPVTESPTSKVQVLEAPSLDSDLKQALTLSLAESYRKDSAGETLKEEDDELARALAESLSLSADLEQNVSRSRKHSRPDASHFSKVTQLPAKSENAPHQLRDSSEVDETLLRQRPFPNRDILSEEELEDHAAHGQIMQELEDEEVTRRLQEEEETRLAAELGERERQDAERARSDAELMERLQEEDARRLEVEQREREQRDEERARLDAELARREAAEEKAQKMIREAQERKDAEMARRMIETNDVGRQTPKGVAPALLPKASGLPQYDDVVWSLPATTRPIPRTTQSSPQLYNGAPQVMRSGRATSSSVSGSVRPQEQVDYTKSGTVSAGADGRRSHNGSSLGGVPSDSRDSSLGDRKNAGPGPSAGPSPSASASSHESPSAASQSNAEEPHVLKGVSYGFRPPDTRSAPAQSGASLCPPFPEVISLFRAPSPPFHIMATSWRHLMRLLAQLETRIEANLDAIAHSKEDHLLRVVVQFAKLAYSTNTWHTILHLTLYQPVPHNVPDFFRYTNKDTAQLPYSYTLSGPVPYLVNNRQSQLYVIPLSPTSPFPILPISLPNLALYLQSAMRDSRARKVQNDPSNGMRRLAKMVMEWYPEEVVNPDKEERKPSRGVGNLLKRVVGRGGGREESQENEDVYDIITPFRIDQYTAS